MGLARRLLSALPKRLAAVHLKSGVRHLCAAATPEAGGRIRGRAATRLPGQRICGRPKRRGVFCGVGSVRLPRLSKPLHPSSLSRRRPFLLFRRTSSSCHCHCDRDSHFGGIQKPIRISQGLKFAAARRRFWQGRETCGCPELAPHTFCVAT